jgi:hypothetical protein
MEKRALARQLPEVNRAKKVRLIPVIAVFVLSMWSGGSALAIEVGDVFWLSSSGVGRTVVATGIAQPGVTRVEYKILHENAAEYCQRYEQKQRMSPEHDKCVAKLLEKTKPETALINCRTRVIVLDYGSFAKGTDHFWRSKTDQNSFILGDELFKQSCGTSSTSTDSTKNSAPSRQGAEDPIKNLATFQGTCRYEVVAGFFNCDPKVAYAQLRNGRSVLVFIDGDTMFTLSGGKDRQPNPENYYLSIDKFKMESKGRGPAEDPSMEGECHFNLNADASKFFYIKCDIYNRARGTKYSFYLEKIQSVSRKSN